MQFTYILACFASKCCFQALVPPSLDIRFTSIRPPSTLRHDADVPFQPPFSPSDATITIRTILNTSLTAPPLQ